jgi:hypothetical protein
VRRARARHSEQARARRARDKPAGKGGQAGKGEQAGNGARRSSRQWRTTIKQARARTLPRLPVPVRLLGFISLLYRMFIECLLVGCCSLASKASPRRPPKSPRRSGGGWAPSSA